MSKSLRAPWHIDLSCHKADMWGICDDFDMLVIQDETQSHLEHWDKTWYEYIHKLGS